MQRGLWIGGLVLASVSRHVCGQGSSEPFFVLATQGSQAPLISTNALLDLRGLGQPNVLSFAFGFATDEQGSPGKLLDSFTISVVDADAPSLTAIYLTVDASGLVLAPPT